MDTTVPHTVAARRPVTGALVFGGLGAVLFVMAISGFAGYDANLVGGGPDNVAAQNVMLCLGLVFFAGSLASSLVAVVLRLLRR